MSKHKISFGIIYEIILAVLVIFSVIVDLPAKENKVLEIFIWGIFVIDYFTGFIKSENKWTYFKGHPLELISILPLGTIFQTARLIRLIRVIRLISIINRRSFFLENLFNKYKIDKLFIIVVLLMFLSALSMKWIEPSFHSYGDALWWAVVTTTTVGYGDISPHTLIGRIVASILMMVGIGMIGVVTGTISSFFTNNHNAEVPPELSYVRDKMEKFPDLDDSDYEMMILHLRKMQAKQKNMENEIK